MRNRREILVGVGCTAALLPLGTQIATGQSGTPLRRDIAEFEKDASALQALRDAVDVLKKKDDYGKRPALDGWQALAVNHNLWCFGNNNYEIHFGWWFLPWHRAYLIHIEKALQQAINEPRLRLPYWDWVTQTKLPKSFADARYRKGSQTVDNPLHDATRFGPVGQGGDVNFIDLGAPGKTERELVQPSTFDLFAGREPIAEEFHPGTLESTPHNYIHRAIGYDDAADKAGNMAIGLSPLDPAFVLHHGNLDRLWAVWLNQGRKRENPKDPRWLEHRFAFPSSPDFEFTEYKIAQLTNTETSPGNYRYDRERLVEQVVVAGSNRPVTRFSLPRRDSQMRDISGLGLAVEIPDRLQEALSQIAPTAGVAPAPPTGSAVVILEGVPVSDRPATIRVFAKDGAQAPTLIGSFSTLPIRRDKAGTKQHVVLPISEATRQLLSTNKNISISAETVGPQRGPLNIDNFTVEIGQ